MNGIIFDIIDFLSQHLRVMGIRGIPFYAVSPIAEESLKYSNICGEWYVKLAKKRITNFTVINSYLCLFHQDVYGETTKNVFAR
jgi:hypothetical protein